MAREDFERLVLHGLCCEWESAIMQLRPSERKGLARPSFSVRDLKTRWGTWSLERREIALSSDLIRNHSWDSVREVLLHEMAHQYAEEVLRAWDEPPHGQAFRRACDLFRANPKASAGFSLLDERLSEGCPNGRILSTIGKLMALAQSANRFEAEAAMNKAHELIARHQVEFIEGPDAHPLISAFVGRPCLRHFREHYRLSILLQDFYYVFGVWVPAYAMERGRMGTVLEITGRLENVKIARYVHDFVSRFIDAQWLEYANGKKLNRYRKSDFAVGIIEGFRKKMEAKSVCPPSEEMASLSLVKVEDNSLEALVSYRYPHLRKIRGWVVRRDERIVGDGVKIGRNLVLYKGIEERSTERKRLLP